MNKNKHRLRQPSTKAVDARIAKMREEMESHRIKVSLTKKARHWRKIPLTKKAARRLKYSLMKKAG